MNAQKANDIELQISRELGINPGPHPRGTSFAWPNKHYLIRDWLAALGVHPNTIGRTSTIGLETDYNAGRDWVRSHLPLADGEEAPAPKFEPNRPPRNRRGRGLGLNDLESPPGFAPGELQGLLGEAPKVPDVAPQAPQAPFPNPLNIQVNEASLARIAERAIGHRLNDAEARLKKSIADTVADEVDKVKLTERLRREVYDLASEIAAKSAEDTINKLAPRKLEIKIKDEIRVLDAEPRHEAFDRLLFWLALKKHVFIVGPHGTGKTHLGQQLATALGRRYFPIGQTLSKYELSGHKGPTGEYVGTQLREVLENGGLAFIDEGDTWAAAAMVFLNTPLANGYCPFPDKTIKVHPDFLCCIAANTWGHGATMQYQGRNPLDQASLDRFAFEEVDYDENLEIQLYGATPWTKYCHRVRKAARDLRLYEMAPSMRGIAMGNDALRAGASAEMVQKALLWKSAAPDKILKIQNLAGTFSAIRPDLHEVA